VVRHTLRSASAALLAWPTDLGNGEWLPRPELDAVVSRVRNAPHSTTLLLGGPGSGKSAFLAKLGQNLSGDGISVLAIKADLLPEDVRDAASLAAHLAPPVPAGECVRRMAELGKTVVLVDQLDAVAALVDLRTARLNTLLNLVRELDEIPNVHVVCSCREFERRRDSRLLALDAEVVELSLPDWESISPVLQRRGVDPGHWPESFRNLLRPHST
jgi:adenylylsulfate kinase-like enzyme